MNITQTLGLGPETSSKLSLNTTKLPHYFYDITHPRRWTDPFASREDGRDRLVLGVNELRDKIHRDLAYRDWLKRFSLKDRLMKFQRVRVVRDKWQEATHFDWWLGFQDAIFTTFINPENMYYKTEFIQFYVICPEDCELITRHLRKKKHGDLPPRKNKWVAEDPRLKVAYVIPTRCCSQIRNETVGGKLEWEEHL